MRFLSWAVLGDRLHTQSYLEAGGVCYSMCEGGFAQSKMDRSGVNEPALYSLAGTWHKCMRMSFAKCATFRLQTSWFGSMQLQVAAVLTIWVIVVLA